MQVRGVGEKGRGGRVGRKGEHVNEENSISLSQPMQ